jgi:hypothetical protein
VRRCDLNVVGFEYAKKANILPKMPSSKGLREIYCCNICCVKAEAMVINGLPKLFSH